MIRLFRVFIPKSVVVSVISDCVLLYACFLLPLFLLGDNFSLSIYLLYEDGLLKFTVAVLSMILALYYLDLYKEFRIRSRILLVQHITAAIGAVFIVQALLAYANPALVLPRPVVFGGCLVILLVLPLWRLVYTNHVYKGLGSERVLFLGTDVVGVDIAEQFSLRPELGFTCVGFIDAQNAPGTRIAGLPVLGPPSELQRIVAETKPARIAVSLAERRDAMPVNSLLDLRFAGIAIEDASSMYETAFGRVTIRRLRPSQLIFSKELGPRRWSMRLQSIYSFVLGIIGFLIALPVMLLVALAVKVTSRGPILFRQRRVGFNGQHFTLYKFRSMVADAEAKTGAVWATRNDPRVTPIGRVLRQTRLDELPQLINVLRGEMSIVGPRPERPEFVATLSEQIPFYRQRHCVKPGLTGWAQINYKYGETVEDTIVKLEYDLYYIKNLSPSLDVYIIFHTVKVMLFSRLGQ
jgi:exopolysaccharide biosynthesis polyprenyl glycosylphosphotransferase